VRPEDLGDAAQDLGRRRRDEQRDEALVIGTKLVERARDLGTSGDASSREEDLLLHPDVARRQMNPRPEVDGARFGGTFLAVGDGR
jgi:hypothetical protein